jgi:hypothetical protein
MNSASGKFCFQRVWICRKGNIIRKFKNGNCSRYYTLLGKLADAGGEVHHIGSMYGNWQGPLLGIANNTVFRGFTLFGSEIL